MAARPSWIVPREVTTTPSDSPASRSLLLEWRVTLLVTAWPTEADRTTSQHRGDNPSPDSYGNIPVVMITPMQNGADLGNDGNRA